MLAKQEIVLIAHNLRSCHNVGSLLRTCNGLGITKFFASGTTPFPEIESDTRLPHIRDKQTKQIAKTALGAEESIVIKYGDISSIVSNLKDTGHSIYGLEQTEDSQDITTLQANLTKLALVVGNEVAGLDKETLLLCEQIVEIPMMGTKESFNVSVAAGIALWQLRQLNRN